MKKIKVYKSEEGFLSFEREPFIKKRENLTPQIRSGGDKIPIEEAIEILKEIHLYNGVYEGGDAWFLVRIFNCITNGNNLWVKTPCFKNYIPGSGSCLGNEVVINVETYYPRQLLEELKEKGMEKVGYILKIERIYPKWKKVNDIIYPFEVVEIYEGHPLHYPVGEYRIFSVCKDVIEGDQLLSLFEQLNGEDDLHLLLYPDGVAMITNGIAGHPSYWVKVKTKKI